MTEAAYTETENGGLFVESQGSFAPEILPEAPDTVHTREFSNGETRITISATPVAPIGTDREFPYTGSQGWNLAICTETREEGDEDGDTSDYEWDWSAETGLSLPEAIEAAKNYITNINPAHDL